MRSSGHPSLGVALVSLLLIRHRQNSNKMSLIWVDLFKFFREYDSYENPLAKILDSRFARIHIVCPTHYFIYEEYIGSHIYSTLKITHFVTF